MPIAVAGTVALDSVKTPYGQAKEILGGSAAYFSLAARHFTRVGLVAVVGSDFPPRHKQLFTRRGISTRGLTTVERGKTFRWSGEYRDNWNDAHTLRTDLNVLSDFNPQTPPEYRHFPFLFLANIDPDIQQKVLCQMNHPKAVFCDSMNFWIHNKKESLLGVIKKIHGIFLNETEARDLTGETNLFQCALKIQKMGPKVVCVKKGDHGAVLLNGPSVFICPIYPWTKVKDPTGAGDSFAGGFLGYLSKCRTLNDQSFRTATAYGAVMASFTVEDFGPKRLLDLTRQEIQKRFRQLRQVARF